MITLFIVIFFLVLTDALVSVAEAAIYSVPLHRAQMLAKKNKLGKILLSLKESMEIPITTLIALSNFITIAGSIFAGIMATRVFGDRWIGLFSGCLTFLIMIFGEMIPKRLGVKYSSSIALFASPSVKIVSYAFMPFAWMINRITTPLLMSQETITSEEEIAHLVSVAEKEGTIESGEKQLIQRVFHFNDVTAGDIMTPKHLVSFIDGAKTIGDMKDFILRSGNSRLPVFEGEHNNIVGIVHQRNLLIALAKEETGQPIRNYAWEAMMVPESRLIDDLLRDMREKRAQLSVVVSEYGNVIGVVGIEDIIEELVGEIVDEKDVVPEVIKRASKNEIIVHGQTRIPYINHFFNTEIKSRKTINGFLMDKFGELPREGQSLDYPGLQLVADIVGPRTIERVRIIKKT